MRKGTVFYRGGCNHRVPLLLRPTLILGLHLSHLRLAERADGEVLRIPPSLFPGDRSTFLQLKRGDKPVGWYEPSGAPARPCQTAIDRYPPPKTRLPWRERPPRRYTKRVVRHELGQCQALALHRSIEGGNRLTPAVARRLSVATAAPPGTCTQAIARVCHAERRFPSALISLGGRLSRRFQVSGPECVARLADPTGLTRRWAAGRRRRRAGRRSSRPAWRTPSP